MIVSSSGGGALGLAAGAGARVCACVTADRAKSQKAIHRCTTVLENVILSEAKNLCSFLGRTHNRQRCFASLNMTASSMDLQESVDFFGQPSANPFGGGNLFHACFPKPIH